MSKRDLMLHELLKDVELPVKVKDKDGKVWSVRSPDWSGYWSIPEDGGKSRTLGYYTRGYSLAD